MFKVDDEGLAARVCSRLVTTAPLNLCAALLVMILPSLRRSPKAIFGIRAWQQRYFVLTKMSLVYYKGRAEYLKNDPSGVLELEHIAQVCIPEKDDEDGTSTCHQGVVSVAKVQR